MQDVKVYSQKQKPLQTLTGAIQQKRQDRILFTALVYGRALIPVICHAFNSGQIFPSVYPVLTHARRQFFASAGIQ